MEARLLPLSEDGQTGPEPFVLTKAITTTSCDEEPTRMEAATDIQEATLPFVEQSL